MYKPQFCLDWLTLTFLSGTLEIAGERQDATLLRIEAVRLLKTILGLGGKAETTVTLPFYGMSTAERSECGAVIHFSPRFSTSLDCVVVLSGVALVAVRSREGSTRGLAQRAKRLGARCSRIDVALDVFEGSIEGYIDDAREHLTGDVRRSAIVLRPLDDVSGTTLYVGSRKSSRFLRIYEKAKQLGVDLGCPWIRIELEAKRKVARAMFNVYERDGIALLVSDIVSRYHFNNEVWNTLLFYATPNKEALRILVEATQGKATKSVWVLRHIAAIAQGIDEMTLNVFITALAGRAKSGCLAGLATDLLELV